VSIRRLTLTLLLAALSAPVFVTPADGHTTPAHPLWIDVLPPCPSSLPPSTRPPLAPPLITPSSLTVLPWLRPAVCRAEPTVQRRGGPPAVDYHPTAEETSTPSGYHHLGATTGEQWSGVMGRLQVRDTGVRNGTYDFVATRFLVKEYLPTGRIAWLEAGWSENGWHGDRQRIYTYDTNTNTWSFYDQYALQEGTQVWIYLEAVANDPNGTWNAWLWWGDTWNLLASRALPVGGQALIEEYVEIHVDSRYAGHIAVPHVLVDNVQLRGDDGSLRYWSSQIPTVTRSNVGGYCLTWQQLYDTFTAGSC